MYQMPAQAYNQPYGQQAYSGYASYQPAYQAPQTQPPMIRGRMVSCDKDILPNEVPMDGTPGFFPLNDLGEIIVKSWNSDGTISTLTYRPVENHDAASDISGTSSIDNLESKIDDLSAHIPAIMEEIRSLKEAVI